MNNIKESRDISYSAKFNITAEGGQDVQHIITNEDFLLKRIDIHAYSKNDGNIFGISNSSAPADRFEVQMKQITNVNYNFFNNPIDIGQFDPLRPVGVGNIMSPHVLSNKNDIEITIHHDRRVDSGHFDLISTMNPIFLEVIFSGAVVVAS